MIMAELRNLGRASRQSLDIKGRHCPAQDYTPQKRSLLDHTLLCHIDQLPSSIVINSTSAGARHSEEAARLV